MRSLTITCLLVATQWAWAVDDTAQFIGSWELVSVENHGADGSVTQPLGDHPVGRITYTTDGLMSAHVMHGDRQNFSTPDLYGGTVEEKSAAYSTYIAYFGSFKVDVTAQSVTHHVTGSLFPNWVGGSQVRFYKFEDDKLILTGTPFPGAGTKIRPYVVWRKAQ